MATASAQHAQQQQCVLKLADLGSVALRILHVFWSCIPFEGCMTAC